MRMLAITRVVSALFLGAALLAPLTTFADQGDHGHQDKRPPARATSTPPAPTHATTTTSTASTTPTHATTTQATTTRSFGKDLSDYFKRFLNPAKPATTTTSTVSGDAHPVSAPGRTNASPSLLANLRKSLGSFGEPSTTTYPAAPYTPGERNAMLGGAGLLGALGFALRMLGRH